MTKRFLACSLDQPLLLPPVLQDWLPEDHLARLIADVVQELDLSALLEAYERGDGRGKAAYHPEMMTRLLLYAYLIGQPSSRAIEKATHTDLAFRFLAANQHPDHDTIAAFRQRHLAALAALFIQVLRLCDKAGLVKLGHVALDGTKIKAHAQKRRSVSYTRLTEREQYWQNQINTLLAQAAAVDQSESQATPAAALPATLANARQRLAALRQAKEALEREAQQKVEATRLAVDEAARQRTRVPVAGSAERVVYEKHKRAHSRAKRNAAAPESSYNFTDPDSRLMRDGATRATLQAYNAQAAVDEAAHIIVAASLTQEENDRHQLAPLLQAVETNLGSQPAFTTADHGYWDTEMILAVEQQGFAVLVPPPIPGPPSASGETANPLAVAMRQRLEQAAAKALYRKRQGTVEPVFGNIKQARGFRQFSFRGTAKVAAEWQLICLTHNLRKLARHRRRSAPSPRLFAPYLCCLRRACFAKPCRLLLAYAASFFSPTRSRADRLCAIDRPGRRSVPRRGTL